MRTYYCIVIETEVKKAQKEAPSVDGISKSERLKTISENRKKEKQRILEECRQPADTAANKDCSSAAESTAFLTPVEKMLYEMALKKSKEE